MYVPVKYILMQTCRYKGPKCEVGEQGGNNVGNERTYCRYKYWVISTVMIGYRMNY